MGEKWQSSKSSRPLARLNFTLPLDVGGGGGSGPGPAYNHSVDVIGNSGTSSPEVLTQGSSHNVLAYILVPLGALAFIAIISFIVVFIMRKSKLDRLRHHLMPLYNFDPAEEEEGDWESELLEEDREQQVALHAAQSPMSPLTGPKLKFHSDL